MTGVTGRSGPRRAPGRFFDARRDRRERPRADRDRPLAPKLGACVIDAPQVAGSLEDRRSTLRDINALGARIEALAPATASFMVASTDIQCDSLGELDILAIRHGTPTPTT